MKYYDSAHKRLVFMEQKATPEHWDSVWAATDFKKLPEQIAGFQWMVDVTKKYLTSNTKVIDAGCGQGITVVALDKAGFEAYGIDTALDTIEQIKKNAPSLNVSVGDINAMPFADNFFDGYWSLGVIEHDYDGYEKALQEMYRVIKPGGYLFLTVPAMSLLRRLKAELGLYEKFEPEKLELTNFYQFALSADLLKKDLQKKGFKIVHQEYRDGFKGLKDELASLSPIWNYLKQSQSVAARVIRALLSVVASPWAGHIVLLVARKEIIKN